MRRGWRKQKLLLKWKKIINLTKKNKNKYLIITILNFLPLAMIAFICCQSEYPAFMFQFLLLMNHISAFIIFLRCLYYPKESCAVHKILQLISLNHPTIFSFPLMLYTSVWALFFNISLMLMINEKFKYYILTTNQELFAITDCK